MNWLILALLAPMFYSIVNFIDKYVVEREVRHTLAMPIFVALMNGPAALLFWSQGGWSPVITTDHLIIMFTGAMIVTAAVLYFTAVQNESASNMIIFLQMTPVFTLVFATIFLQERLTPQQLVGFILIFGAAFTVSAFSNRQTAGKFKLSRGFLLMIIATIMLATNGILLKFATDTVGGTSLLGYEAAGKVVGGVILYLFVPHVRHAFNQSLREMRNTGFLAISLNETVYVIASTCTLLAISGGPVTLVSVLGSTQVFYGVLLSVLLMRVAPQTFKEDVSRRGLSLKLAGAAAVVLGIVLLS
ncbi:MAG: hypothetical protein D6712_14345 [Chloroflexi bacterium]|nr:MAG: hypothetical protein D6712_14345 [Chloroflexota bacterium]